MFGFSKRDPSGIFSKKLDRELSAIAVNELESDNKDAGVWGQAIVKAKGDYNKAVYQYIELRIASLKDELAEESKRLSKQTELAKEEKEKEYEISRKAKEREGYSKRLERESLKGLKNYPAFMPFLYKEKAHFSDTEELISHLLKMHRSVNLTELLKDAQIKKINDQYYYLSCGFPTYGEALKQYWHVISKAMKLIN